MVETALVGSLPTSLDNVVVWDIDEDTDDLKAIQSTSSSSASLQPSSHVDLDEMMKWTDSDFLPPGKPAMNPLDLRPSLPCQTCC